MEIVHGINFCRVHRRLLVQHLKYLRELPDEDKADHVTHGKQQELCLLFKNEKAC